MSINPPLIELVYETSCPNIDMARERIRLALEACGLAPDWREHDVNDQAAPAYVHGYGSPTILVNGEDVSATPIPGHDLCCRLYDDNGKTSGAPTVATIIHALEQPRGKHVTPRFLKFNSGLVPVIGTALMPKLFCPACWPAYAGVLGSFGIGFVNYTPWLMPLTLFFSVAVLVSLLWKADQRRGYNPFVAGLVSVVLIMVGKFVSESDLSMYAGLAGLIAASLWNSWPRTPEPAAGQCPACQAQPVAAADS
ncbi:MAG: hypothetical protein OEZ10_12235 [Gammaproteobacteria bacterium]|nr:hypothetical protein [Gammaproteobacteria bacterium]